MEKCTLKKSILKIEKIYHFGVCHLVVLILHLTLNSADLNCAGPLTHDIFSVKVLEKFFGDL